MTSLLAYTLIIILVSAAAVAVFVRLRLPATLGYLLAGLLIGPHGLGLVGPSEEAEFLAELGLIFLLFTVGLEFSLPALLASRRDVLGAGGLQVLLTALPVAGFMIFVIPVPAAIIVGAAVAMSSTAITLKQLAEQGEISTRHGRLAVCVLLFQDIATIPFLVMINAWSGETEPGVMDVLRQLGMAAFVLALAAVVARPLFRAGLAWVAQTRSAELFLITVLLIALGTAFGVNLAGLSAPVGAFVAGMVVGESDFRHRVEDDMRPFRDALVGLFFVTVGMKIDPAIALAAPVAVAGWTLIFLLVKPAAIFAVGTMMQWPVAARLRTSAMLAHGGEFGLLLLTSAMAVGVLTEQIGQPLIVALVITIGTAALVIQHSGWAERLVGRTNEAPIDTNSAGSLENHIVLCGCGRVGRLVALALEAAQVPYVALESDLGRFRQAQSLSHQVFYGDAASGRMLDSAGIGKANLLVVTFDHHAAAGRVLRLAHQRNPAIRSIVSAADDHETTSLVKAGAAAVFPENLAVGLALADQALLMCGLSQDRAAHVVTAVREQLNPELREKVGI